MSVQHGQVRGAAPSVGWRYSWCEVHSDAPQACQGGWPDALRRECVEALSCLLPRCGRPGSASTPKRRLVAGVIVSLTHMYSICLCHTMYALCCFPLSCVILAGVLCIVLFGLVVHCILSSLSASTTTSESAQPRRDAATAILRAGWLKLLVDELRCVGRVGLASVLFAGVSILAGRRSARRGRPQLPGSFQTKHTGGAGLCGPRSSVGEQRIGRHVSVNLIWVVGTSNIPMD